LELKVTDLFIAETISDLKPVKLLGEWFNEIEHPRDSNDGLLMIKIVNWKPVNRITPENEIANDENHAVLHILPLRCFIDQRGLRFARAFFTSDEVKPPHKWATHLKELPPPRFSWFKVKACKMKVNYTPEKVDVEALRDGAIVELINLSPLNDMVIGLQAVELKDKVGFGSVMGDLASCWVKDICATQMYKFVANASPFQPITSIGGGAADMVILPWEAIRNGDDVSRAIRSGLSSFGGTFAFETLNATARLTNFAAQRLQKSIPSFVPSRPQDTPRNVGETTTHAMESLARGLDHANYKIVVIPYKEFQDKGAASAAKSVVKGIPVAILAPLASMNEAVSYTLLGARNMLRPDIRKEDEATQSGLHYDF
jgi:autophagy-related protein 2